MSIQRGLEGKRTPCLGMRGKDERCRGPSCCCPGVWPTMGTCCLEGCGTGHDAITLLFHPSCKLGRSCCLFGLCDQRLFKPLLDCLSRKQTDKVSQVFFWCLSLLPLKMGSAVFLCTPQKLIGAKLISCPEIYLWLDNKRSAQNVISLYFVPMKCSLLLPLPVPALLHLADMNITTYSRTVCSGALASDLPYLWVQCTFR